MVFFGATSVITYILLLGGSGSYVVWEIEPILKINAPFIVQLGFGGTFLSMKDCIFI